MLPNDLKSMRIIFLGTSDFSLKCLAALEHDGFNVVAVYTQAPKPSGRSYQIKKSAVQEFAEKKTPRIPIHTPKSLRNEEQLELFRALKPDLAVVSSYGLIIPQNILDIPTYGFINIHASILPRWRGAAPIQAAILAGDRETGISIMKMDAGVDTGDVIATRSLAITPETNHGELSEKLGIMGAEMILETLHNLEKNLAGAHPQPEHGATYAAKISKESCRINWNNASENILRQIRAFSPVPSAWSEIEGVRVKILDAAVAPDASLPHSAGTLLEDGAVCCSIGRLKLLEIQPEGKKKMKAEDFIRGHKNFLGKAFA
ncbi:MAG: methionyl-tRNA formyltransferase [Holosporaceae bacterium]|jgi:methionyl-tRNA formyltransferase|nr:methionyl-tRNA formyltransferase [Holosporaceae bacterium]